MKKWNEMWNTRDQPAFEQEIGRLANERRGGIFACVALSGIGEPAVQLRRVLTYGNKSRTP
jgi:hypothetical protein